MESRDYDSGCEIEDLDDSPDFDLGNSGFGFDSEHGSESPGSPGYLEYLDQLEPDCAADQTFPNLCGPRLL